MRFQVLMAASMKMAVLWDVTSRGLVEDYRRFRGVCCLQHNNDESSLPITFTLDICTNFNTHLISRPTLISDFILSIMDDLIISKCTRLK
jgi:hypothetical protein